MLKWISPSTLEMRLSLKSKPVLQLGFSGHSGDCTDECREEKSLLKRDVREMNGALCFFCNEKSNDIEGQKKRFEIRL